MSAPVTLESPERRRARQASIASSTPLRMARMRALREAGDDHSDPQRELLALARSGDEYAMWRADELFVNWRRGRKLRTEDE